MNETRFAVSMPPDDVWILLLSAVRYALGRATYIVGETCGLVARYAPRLTPAQHRQLIAEVEQALHFQERRGDTLGMEMDHRRWQQLVTEQLAVLVQRNA